MKLINKIANIHAMQCDDLTYVYIGCGYPGQISINM